MKIYTVDKDGYIVGNKNVGSKCNIGTYDFKGEPPFANGCHYINGIKRPETQEQSIEAEIEELNKWLDLRRNIEHPEKAIKQARLLELIG